MKMKLERDQWERRRKSCGRSLDGTGGRNGGKEKGDKRESHMTRQNEGRDLDRVLDTASSRFREK